MSINDADYEDFRPSQFRISYFHQIPCKPYIREVETPQLGEELLDCIYETVLHMFDNRMIPDYTNAGIVEFLDYDGDWCTYEATDWE